MNNITVPKHHMSYTYTSGFINLCRPLFHNTNIDSFHYVRTYLDGTHISLNTDLKIEKFELFDSKGRFSHDAKILEAAFASNRFKSNHNINKICIFTEEDDDGYWTNMFKKFNIKSCFNIIEKSNNYYERFGFRSRYNKSSYSFYINHHEMLENFISYFKEQGNNIIGIAEKNKITWSNNHPEYCRIVQKLKAQIINDNDFNYITKKTHPYNNRNHIGGDISFTRRESECLFFVLRGAPLPKIAKILNISHRTVEKHVENIKVKMGVHFKSQLIEKAIKDGYLYSIPCSLAETNKTPKSM